MSADNRIEWMILLPYARANVITDGQYLSRPFNEHVQKRFGLFPRQSPFDWMTDRRLETVSSWVAEQGGSLVRLYPTVTAPESKQEEVLVVDREIAQAMSRMSAEERKADVPEVQIEVREASTQEGTLFIVPEVVKRLLEKELTVKRNELQRSRLDRKRAQQSIDEGLALETVLRNEIEEIETLLAKEPKAEDPIPRMPISISRDSAHQRDSDREWTPNPDVARPPFRNG